MSEQSDTIFERMMRRLDFYERVDDLEEQAAKAKAAAERDIRDRQQHLYPYYTPPPWDNTERTWKRHVAALAKVRELGAFTPACTSYINEFAERAALEL